VNFIFTLNLPSNLKLPTEAGSNIQQIHAKMDVGSMQELVLMMQKTDFIIGREFFVRKKFDNTKWIEDRGDIVIAVPLIGKVKEYFE
jgi:hypothetical protein